MIETFWLKLGTHFFKSQWTFESRLSNLTLLWGLWLINPAVNTFATGSGYRVMANIMDEFFWGLLLIFMGIRVRIALERNNLRAKRDGIFGMLVLWLFITIMIVAGNPGSTGAVVYGWITYNIARGYIIISQQVRLTEANHETITN